MTAAPTPGAPDGAQPGTPGGAPPDPAPLLDFAAVRARLRRLVLGAAVVAVVGMGAEAVTGGAVGAVLGRWVGVFGVLVLLGAAAVVALSALGGADRVQRRGERLAGDDVGFLPPRRP